MLKKCGKVELHCHETLLTTVWRKHYAAAAGQWRVLRQQQSRSRGGTRWDSSPTLEWSNTASALHSSHQSGVSCSSDDTGQQSLSLPKIGSISGSISGSSSSSYTTHVQHHIGTQQSSVLAALGLSMLLLTCTFTVIIRFIRPMAVIRKCTVDWKNRVYALRRVSVQLKWFW